MLSSVPADKGSRKRLGAWYTPPSIVSFLVRWAVRTAESRVLDPAVGDGAFLVEASRQLGALGQKAPERQVFGVDVRTEAVTATRASLASIVSHSPQLVVSDFFEVEPPTSLLPQLPAMDAVVGNPPYIRYQAFAGRTRALAVERGREAGVHLSRLGSSWAAFVVHATSFVREGGCLAFVLPEELAQASYAEPIRAFLRRTFRKTTVIAFDEFLFPGSQERVVLLLADGKGVGPAGKLAFARVPRPEDLGVYDDTLPGEEVFEEGTQPEKWHPGSEDEAARLLDELFRHDKMVPLRSIARTGIGYVTGANDYFVLRPSEATRRAFPAEALRSTVIAARHVPGAVLSAHDVAAMMARDERCLLWSGAGGHDQAVAQYLEEGRERGIPQRYKCRVRDPWYVVPGVTVPEAFLTYMSHDVPRLTLNSALTTCSNNLLAVQSYSVDGPITPSLVASFYNSATMLSAERTGRHYGGGVLKLEPSEAGRVLVPRLGRHEAASLEGLLEEIDRFIRSHQTGQALALIDSLVLRQFMGLGAFEIRLIQESRGRRQRVRLGERGHALRTRPTE